MEATDADRLALKETLEKFADACNDALTHAKETGRTHRYALQSDVYKLLKVRHKLTACYAVRACDRVAADFPSR